MDLASLGRRGGQATKLSAESYSGRFDSAQKVVGNSHELKPTLGGVVIKREPNSAHEGVLPK